MNAHTPAELHAWVTAGQLRRQEMIEHVRARGVCRSFSEFRGLARTCVRLGESLIALGQRLQRPSRPAPLLP